MVAREESEVMGHSSPSSVLRGLAVARSYGCPGVLIHNPKTVMSAPPFLPEGL